MIRPRKPARPSRRFRLRPAVDRLEGRSLMATAGVLDPTFGAGSGQVLLPVTTQNNFIQGLEELQKVQVEPDGSIVAAGGAVVNETATVGVVHLNADGTLDTTFGTDGVAYVTPPSGTSIDDFSQLLVQPSTGDIIVVGEFEVNSQSAGTIVAELNPDGSPNTAFGSDGVALLSQSAIQAAFGLEADFSAFAALQPDGKIVLVGTHGITIPNTDLGSEEVAVARLNTDGSLDTSFAGQGVETVSSIPQADFTKLTMLNGGESQAANEIPAGLAIQPNGQIVILTSYFDYDLTDQPQRSVSLIRVNNDGSVNTSLSQTGIRTFDASTSEFNGTTLGLIAEPDGGFLALIEGQLALINADGSLGNVATFAPGNPPSAFTLLPDGDVAVLGSSSTDAYRLTPNLTYDGSFGDGGIAGFTVTPPAKQPSFDLDAIAAGPDGGIVLVGSNPGTGPLGFPTLPTEDVVARLTTTGTPVTSGDFSGDGISDIAIYLPQYGAFAITDSSGQTPGQIVPFGIPGPGQTIPAPGDYYGTGQEDIAAYLPTYGAYAIKDPTGQTPGIDIPFGIAGVGQTIPAPGDYYGTGQDDIAVYLTALGVFAIKDPTGKTPGEEVQFGQAGAGNSIPVSGDYYGTGQDDIAVYLPQSAVWAIQDPTGKTNGEVIPFGKPGIGQSIPVPGDYDDSGRTELAVYVPSLAEIIYRPANGGADVTIPFGMPGIGNTLPAPGDYDGSGKTEVAAYLPSLGIFAYRPANGGADVYDSIGIPGPGQTIPVTTVVLSPFPGTASGSGSGSPDAIEIPGVMGEADPLDFLILPESSAKKSKA